MTSGVLPRVLPGAEKIAPGQISRAAQIFIGTESQERCLVCEELGPHVPYTYPGGKVVRLHAACDAVWQQERSA
jgi:hypothetical protein